MGKDSTTVQPLRLLVEAAKFKHPEIATHGANYLVDCALAAFCGLPPPKPPRERQAEGGAKVSGQAKNPHRKKKI